MTEIADLQSTVSGMKVKQDTMFDDVKFIKEKMITLPCAVHSTKIGLLNKIVFGAITLVLIGFMGVIIKGVFG